MLSQVRAQLAEKFIELEVTDAARDLLSDKGYDPTFGARPLRRAIQNMVEDPLSEAILSSQFQAGDTVIVDCEDENIVLRSAALAGSVS